MNRYYDRLLPLFRQFGGKYNSKMKLWEVGWDSVGWADLA